MNESQKYLTLKEMNIKSHGSERHFFNRQHINDRIKEYGFIETADILKFLKLMCRDELDIGDLSYIRAKLGICLRRHDNGSDYFIHLREFASELDCLNIMRFF